MNKKAQGLSVNTIIIAAIALIVLVVLVAVFTGKLGDWGKNLKAAENKYCGDVPASETEPASSAGGKVTTGSSCGKQTQIYGNFKELKSGQICCSTT